MTDKTASKRLAPAPVEQIESLTPEAALFHLYRVGTYYNNMLDRIQQLRININQYNRAVRWTKAMRDITDILAEIEEEAEEATGTWNDATVLHGWTLEAIIGHLEARRAAAVAALDKVPLPLDTGETNAP